MELVGMEIRKKFKGFGVYRGSVQSYDAAAGYFRIQYEDGDSEDVDFDEIMSIVNEMGRSSPKSEPSVRRRGRPAKKRRQLDENSSPEPNSGLNSESDLTMSEIGKTLVDVKVGILEENGHLRVSEEIQANGGCNGGEERKRRLGMLGAETSTVETPLRKSARRGTGAVKFEDELVSEDADLGGGDMRIESSSVGQMPSKLELPPSSSDIDLAGLNPFDLFSVYTCLRSFSRLLFLSPFRLETFVVALRCRYANPLFDSIHFSLLQALKPHLEVLAEEGSETASDCLRHLDWELLDMVTWPVFVVHYLLIRGSRMKHHFRLSQLKLLDSEYYEQPAEVKLEMLRCLCDDAIEVDAIRSELNRRMETETNEDETFINLNTEQRRKSCFSISPPAEGSEGTDDGNIDECCLCGMDGNLICCDGCPAAFHSKCVGVAKELLPEGDWYCPECSVEKGDGLVELSKPSRGAELLGIDVHGHLYFGCCDRLLVSESRESDASYYYYNKNDMGAIISVLNSCYSSGEIANAISTYFRVSICVTSTDHSGNFNSDGIKEELVAQRNSEPPLPSAHNLSSDVSAERLGVDISASAGQNGHSNSRILDVDNLNSVISHELPEVSRLSSCTEPLDGSKDTATCIQTSDEKIPGRFLGFGSPDPNSASDLGLSYIDHKMPYDPGNYVNYHAFGRIASLISLELMPKSLEDKANESKKSVEDIKSAQLKAISKKSIKACCSAYQKTFINLQKENCGWCFSCKTSSDFDCLFKVAADKNLKRFKEKGVESSKGRKLADLEIERSGCSSGYNRSHLSSAVNHILSIESRCRSLLSGPWEKPQYSQHWRKDVMNASDVASLKLLLLNLESNLRRVALTGGWFKPVDDSHATVSASVVTSLVRGSSCYGTSRKPGRRAISGDESSLTPAVSDIYWWRGGRLSRQVFQCKMLPRSLASKGGRQAGCRKILHMLYPDSSDFAKRSKYVSWRAAVEMSQSVAQLIYQAKVFDSSVKWSELLNARFFLKWAKESKKTVQAMKKVTIRGQHKEGTQLKYLLDFGKGDFVPTIITKYGVLAEESTNESKRYWLSEAHVPLYLLKSYEERKLRKRMTRLLKKTDSEALKTKESTNRAKKRKRSEGFAYLFSKEQHPEKQLCGHCNRDVFVREAINCQHCHGFFHRKHFRVPKGATAETAYTCNGCTKIMTIKDKERKRLKTKATEDAKHKEEDNNNMNLMDRNLGSVNKEAKGRKTVKVKGKTIKSQSPDMDLKGQSPGNRVIKCRSPRKKGKKSRSPRDKDVKSMKLVENCRRSERVKEKYQWRIKVQGHKLVLKQRKISTGRKLEAAAKNGKQVLMRDKKKSNGHKRRKKEKSKIGRSENCESGISCHKRKRSVVRHSYWLNGLRWTCKPATEQQRNFRQKNIVLPFQYTENQVMKPLCCLCHNEYNSGVIYISCEKCQDWFHGNAFDLNLENIGSLVGFRCHRCRLRSKPACPFSKSEAIDPQCETGDVVMNNDHQSEEKEHCGLYIACKEGLSGEQREDVSVEHPTYEEEEFGHSIARKEGLSDEQREDVSVEHPTYEDKELNCLPENCSATDHVCLQNDKKKQCDCSIACEVDRLNGEQREDISVMRLNFEDKGLDNLHDDYSARVYDGISSVDLVGGNVAEKELGRSSKTRLANGCIAGLHCRNISGKCYAGTCGGHSNMVQVQDYIDGRQGNEKHALCPESVSANVVSTESPQQAEANVAFTRIDNEIVEQELHVGGFHRMIEASNFDLPVVGMDSDSAVLDLHIVSPQQAGADVASTRKENEIEAG